MESFAELLDANRAYVEGGARQHAQAPPGRRLAVVTCMDARIDTFAALGLALGDAHIIRNAGGRITDDVLRSLTLSTHLLGTHAVAIVAHTDCGLRDPDGDLVPRLTEAIGHAPQDRDWGAFAEPEAAVTADCEYLRQWPDRPAGLVIGGYVLDVTDGRLREVASPTRASTV